MKIRLQIQDGTKSYERDFSGPSIAIGRNPGGDVILEVEGRESVVSWEHARIDLSSAEATLTDLRSTNGTFRNGAPVTGSTPITTSDSIRFGQTGPVLTVLALDLTSAKVAPPPLPVAVAAAKPQAAKPVVSGTRGIALQAVRQLKSQEESLRKQQRAHARNRNLTIGIAIVSLLLFLLLGGGLLVYTGKLNLLGHRVDDNEASLKKLGEDMRAQAEDTASHFGKIDQDLTAQSERQKEAFVKIEQVAEHAIAREAQQRGGMERLKMELGASIDDLSKRIAPSPTVIQEPPPDRDPPRSTPQASRPSPRVEPGMKMDVLHKNGNYYTGVLLGISNTEVRLQTNPHEGAKPSKFDIRDVQAFQTRDGIFAYDESARDFEPALTFFRFQWSGGEGRFERIESPGQDVFLAEDAQVLGPTNSVKAVLARGPSGEWSVGLPIPLARSPHSIPAYHFKEIITLKGVYSYDSGKHDYAYKPHTQIAAEAKAASDEAWRQYDEKKWQRRKEDYQLGTERVRALAPLYRSAWWWW